MPEKSIRQPLVKQRKVTKRSLQAIETRNRIYESATKLMERSGFDNITIEQISRAAEVSVGAFYHHFGSKNDILNEIFKRADDYFSEKVIESLNGKSTAEKIVSYFVHYARFNIDLGVDHVSALYKTHSKFFISSKRFMYTALRDIIVEAVQKKEMKTEIGPEEIADFLFITARGLTYNWCLHDGQFPLEEKMARYMTFQVRALTLE